MRSARLPGVSEPVRSAIPSSFAPSIVASSTSRFGLSRCGAPRALPVRPHQRAHDVEEIRIGRRRGVNRQAERDAHLVQLEILNVAVAHRRIRHLDHRRDAPWRLAVADHLQLVGGHALRMHQQHVGSEQVVLAHQVDQVLRARNGSSSAGRACGRRRTRCGTARPGSSRAAGRARRAQAGADAEHAVRALLLHPREIGEVHRACRAGGPAPCHRRSVRGCRYRSAPVARRRRAAANRVVRPVVHRGDAGQQALGDAEPHAGIGNPAA